MKGVLGFIRQLVPLLLVPLCLAASLLSAAPWLRSFPLSIAGLPLYGAAILSVLVPFAAVRMRPSWLWLSVLVDVAVFVLYSLVVVLHSPTGFGDLVTGLYRGPSQLLTFALPLVSPRNLMVAPVALTWLAGALAGECLARRWYTLLPYVGFLVSFGLAYAGTQRAADLDADAAQLRQTVLAALLIGTLLLMRVAQAWVRQDETAEQTQPDGILPLRGLAVGTITTLVVVLAASLLVQTRVFPKSSETPQRVPLVNDSNPLTPLAFVASLRPRTASDPQQELFTVSLDKPTPGYFGIANLDTYDGSGWSFERTFRPSGGVLPADADPALRSPRVVRQDYQIAPGPMTSAPWMPYLYRPQRVTGVSVNIDPASGMIVPAGRLEGGQAYRVTSTIAPKTFDAMTARNVQPDLATPAVDVQLAPGLRTTLDRLVKTFSTETGIPSSPQLPFLQAMQRDLLSRYALSSAAQGSASSSSPSPSSSRTPSPANSGPASDLAGGTGFADVLGSILGSGHNGTPEQFATLLALVARDIGVPARVVTGFKVSVPDSGAELAAGQYRVTSADAWTWTEIPIVGQGWVVVDGSPTRFAAANQQTESAAASQPPSSNASPTQRVLITQGGNGHAVASKSPVPGESSAPTSAILIALVVVLALIFLGLFAVVLARKPRRAARRRRGGDPRHRVIGAWEETIDMLTESGLPEMSALTSAEIATLTAAQFGAETGQATATLGAAANIVAYSPSTYVTDADADLAWNEQRVLRRQVRGTLGFRDRVAARFRYHRSSRGAAPKSPPSWAESAAATHGQHRDPGRGRRTYRGRRRAH